MEKTVATFLLGLSVLTAPQPIATTPTHPAHGLAIHGDLKYSPNFKHFDYVNPNAPKGGLIVQHAIGTFDDLNPLNLKGNDAAASWQIHASLMAHSSDEPASSYCFVCETVETPANRSWVAFTLRKNAKFHDGSSITAEDVIFSFNILKEKGHPFYRQYYKDVIRAEHIGERKVRFIFRSAGNRELPVIIGELPVLSKNYWSKRDFTKTTLEPPLGSGPYKIKHIDAGRSITYERVKNWWGENLPINKGQNNFDLIKYIYSH